MLVNLCTELIVNIIGFCDVKDVLNLRLTCRRLNKIIKDDLPCNLFGHLLITGQGTDVVRKRSQIRLNCLEKFRILNNWKYKFPVHKTYLYDRQKYLPRLRLTEDHVWLSRANYVYAYRRKANKIALQPVVTLTAYLNGEVSNFVKTDLGVIAGLTCGNVWVWFTANNNLVASKELNSSDIHDVDVNKTLIISGCRNGEFALWTIKEEINDVIQLDKRSLENRIWSTGFNESGNYIALGTSCYPVNVPLYIFDSTRLDTPLHIYGSHLQRGSSVLHIKWLDNNLLLTCGHDCSVRKWDVRVPEKNIQSWEDPFFETIYCLDTDNVNTLLTGTQNHGRITLYDMRCTRYMKMYSLKATRRHNSPVYSFAFEPRLLFGVTDQYLHVLDFANAYF